MEPRICPNCHHGSMKSFYEIAPVPVHSVMLVRSLQDALNFPSGRIELAVCDHCGFIGNVAFDEEWMRYSKDCEETQGFSPTFSAFHHRLASDLISRYGLRKKTIMEIGCGKGEFISLLCVLGDNQGIGFDPAFDPQRTPTEGGDRVTFYQELYSERSLRLSADFIVCKMTLEHIPDPFAFLGTIRRAIGEARSLVFFQVPDMRRVLKDIAFWDVYHEHCSYFTEESLRSLFTRNGFDVLESWRDYDDQYLMITAMPGTELPVSQICRPGSTELEAVWSFAKESMLRVKGWKRVLQEASNEGKRVVLWGSGSKAVSFLSSMGEEGSSAVQYVVDINPFRRDCFMPGTGQRIVTPEFLIEYRPDLVVAMNSIYVREIESELRNIHLSSIVLPIEESEASAIRKITHPWIQNSAAQSIESYVQG